MLVRNKPSKLKRKAAPNPLRIDPTRTATLRQQFMAQVSRRFSAFKLALLKLIEGEDALGLNPANHDPFTSNVFCPTGEGGGVDPTCSAGGIEIVEDSRERFVAKFDSEVGTYRVVAQCKPPCLVGKQDFRVDFERVDSSGEVHTEKTGTAGTKALGVFRKVGTAIDTFLKSFEPEKFHFTADNDEPSRVKLYNRLATALAKSHGYDLTASHDGGVSLYSFIRSSITSNLNQTFLEAFDGVTNTRWKFQSSPEKVKAFQAWLKTQIGKHLTGDDERKLWEEYILKGYRKGAGRSYDDVKKQRKRKPSTQVQEEATKQEFIRSSLAAPESIEKVQLLVARSFTDLVGVTGQMELAMTRTLADGLVQGKGPREIARDLVRDVDGIGLVRAKTVARTECLPGDTLVSGAVVRAVFRRWYDGPIIEIETRSGRKFSATPNHPMLTKRGWVAAGILEQGDNLISHNREQNSGPTGNQDIQRNPTTLREIFDSLSAIGVTERERTSKPDFHGDGCDGEVEILRSDRELHVGDFSSLNEPLAKNVLTPSGFADSSFCQLCGRLLSINKQPCLCHGPKRNASSNQSALDSVSVYSQTEGDLNDRFTSKVSIDDQRDIEIGSVLVADPPPIPGVQLSLRDRATNPNLTENFSDLFLVGTHPSSDFPLSEAAQIQIDDVLSVTTRPFSGHVYNLETPFGYYTIDKGYYTGNTIRAHAEGQLEALSQLGVEEVGVAVEWSVVKTANGLPEARVCSKCLPLDGMVLKISEARGMIPRHPNCFFSKSVSIRTTGGDKSIGSITVGDRVLTHTGNYKKVIQVHRTAISQERTPAVKLHVTGYRTLCSTADHPFLKADGTWIAVSELNPGDLVAVIDNGNTNRIRSATVRLVKPYSHHISKSAWLYNLSVEEDESFVANGVVVHNCRCAFRPANVGEDTRGQTRTKADIQRAIRSSVKAEDSEDSDEGGSWGPAQTIAKTRPVNNLDEFSLLLANVFCPTGKGGGIDPTCKKDGTEDNSREQIDRLVTAGKKWVKELEKDEEESLSTYTQDSDRINSALRNGFHNNDVEYIDSALSKSKTTEGFVTYRGLSDDPGFAVGHEFSDRGYASTSLSESLAESFAESHGRTTGGAMYRVLVSPGTHAGYIPSSFSSYAGESEVLLPRGTKFKVKSVKVSDGRPVYDLEIIDYPKPQISEDYTENYSVLVNVFCPTGIGGGIDPHCSLGGSKSVESKSSSGVGGPEQEWADKVSHSVAHGIGGRVEEKTGGPGQKDKKPYDVKVPRSKGSGDHDIEVKSLLKRIDSSISVHDDALYRKVQHQDLNPKNTFHTVVVDERDVYEGGKHSGKYSGHKMYYKRGNGRYALSKMHQISNMNELKTLLDMPDNLLPENAKGSLPPPPPLNILKAKAEKATAARNKKDKARKLRNVDKLREQSRARYAKLRQERVA